jgi:hypothetical protein
VATWGELRAARPDLAEAGTALLYQFGVGLGFLATVRKDGGPRVHPMCPLLTDDGLYALLVPSPKCDDLRRDGRYALHGFPRPDDEDAVYLTGTATVVDDAGACRTLLEQFVAERAGIGMTLESLHPNQTVFAFDVEMCMVTRTTGHGDPAPQHEIWHAPTR